MTHEIDDDRLTAYALGELEGAEAAEVEALLATNPDARREVDAIRTLARSLTAELGREPASPLTGHQRAAIGRRPAIWVQAPTHLHNHHLRVLI